MTVTVERGDTATVLNKVSDVEDVDALIGAIDDAEADLLELEDTVDLHQLINLSFVFETPDGEQLDDNSFFEHACTSERGRERTAAFLETYLGCLDDAHDGSYPILWRDHESQTLDWGAYQLALASEEYVPLYAKSLERTDMDHEVFQGNQIDDLIDEHGWTDGIETLLAVRGSTAWGQHGLEQVEEYRDFIREHISTPRYESSMFDAFLAFYRSDLNDGPLPWAEKHGEMLLDMDEQEAWMDRVRRELDV